MAQLALIARVNAAASIGALSGLIRERTRAMQQFAEQRMNQRAAAGGGAGSAAKAKGKDSPVVCQVMIIRFAACTSSS